MEDSSTGCHPGCYFYSDSCFRQDCKRKQQLTVNQPQLRAVPMNLFPTMGSLQEVVDFGDSKLPITNKNELYCLLMIYHNTLLKRLNGE